MKKARLHTADKLFSALAYDPEHHVFLLADSSIGFGFICRPLTGADHSVSSRVNVLLNQDWPTETLLQISLWTSPDIEEALAVMQTRRLKQQKPTYKAMTRSSIEFLRQGTVKPPEAISGARLRRSHIIVTVKLPIAHPRPGDSEMRNAAELQIITQSVNDLYRNAAGRAIVENSANMYLLGQKAEVIEGMKQDRRLPLSDGGYELLKTVHTLPGAYSEIFFITEMGSGIGRLIVDPFKRILFSTKPEDVQAIKLLRRQGLSLGDAVKELIDSRQSKTREREVNRA
jgi:hypothetical protein